MPRISCTFSLQWRNFSNKAVVVVARWIVLEGASVRLEKPWSGAQSARAPPGFSVEAPRAPWRWQRTACWSTPVSLSVLCQPNVYRCLPAEKTRVVGRLRVKAPSAPVIRNGGGGVGGARAFRWSWSPKEQSAALEIAHVLNSHRLLL